MSYKKIALLFVGLIPLVSSCSIPGFSQKEDFSSLYIAHTKSQVSSFRTIAEKLGYVGKYETNGSLRASVDIPTILSGAASTTYNAVIEGYGLSQDSRVTFMSPSLHYETLLASGSLLAKEASFISRGGDMYIKYDGIDGVEMIDAAMKEVFAKYNNIWLALTEKNLLETLSGSSEEDKIAYQMSQAIGKLKLDEVEMYLTKYPLWKEKKSLGTKDGMTSFEVELATENIIGLVSEFSEKSTGKGLSDEARKSLESSLSEKKIEGTIAYDPKNSKISTSNLRLISPDGAMTLVLDEGIDGWKLSSTSSGSTFTASLSEKGDGYSIAASIVEGDAEIGRVDANIAFRGTKFSHFDAKLSSKEDGLTLTIEHNLASDGTFTGSLDAGVGNLSWNGKVSDTLTLESFHLKGAMIGTSLTVDLTPGTDGMLRGPLLLKSGDEVVVQADVGLTLSKEKIHLILDVPNPETPNISSHAEIQIEGKREKWSGNIEIPKESTPFSELSEALRAIAPADTWTDDTLTDESQSTIDESDSTISGTVLQ